MTSFLDLFRQGYDTAQISAMTGEPEHVVYNMMHREKLGQVERTYTPRPKRIQSNSKRPYAGKEFA